VKLVNYIQYRHGHVMGGDLGGLRGTVPPTFDVGDSSCIRPQYLVHTCRVFN